MLAAPETGGRTGRPTLIAGGAGFIGANLADSIAGSGGEVIVLDNLSRAGVEQNLAWLESRHRGRVHRVIADVRDEAALERLVRDAGAVFHFAAQTAVTTSLADPRADFEVNAGGTFNVLEAARKTGRAIPVVFSSTNKVYGGLDDIALVELDDRYVPVDEKTRAHGVDESRPLDFCTPYGCSKGAADQYVLDYGKSFGLPTAVLRMSCIYGPRQFGTEDQGWVAHFLIRALSGEPITIYGDGRQVRDILNVADAVAAYRAVLADIGRLAGRAFNLGGGPHNAVSLRRLLIEIGRVIGGEPAVEFRDWRPGDQLYFVADTRRLQAATPWRAAVPWRDGVRELAAWLAENRLRPAEPRVQRRITA
ncbi:NAD-dependent epimerase/dehydratase family protein [Prosthecomicrobium pneumaticum]|uniref:CDP-paratose 2-epimerase n=1 Tax=Prosthecomicrobium pneumaticum TaxID=81895 RepID=A0A7W9FKW0_9HYPH|nr:CDP-paratose 2-epimerase [Prosthecomicrobium pneumaticum]